MDKDIILQNIAELRQRRDNAERETELCIELLADALSAEADTHRADELYSLFSKSEFFPSLRERLSFCKALCTLKHLKRISDIPPFADSEIAVTPGSHEKIAFVRNRYNEIAFSSFSAVIPHSSPIYCGNFEDCCEAVASGGCEFAILPIENNSDGKMFGFYSLVDRFELKICAVCDVEGESKTIKYALVCRNYLCTYLEKSFAGKPRYLEIRITYDSEFSSPEVFEAASAAGADIHRTSSIAMPYDDTATRFYYTLRITERTELLPLLLFLSLEYPQYTPVGIYRKVTTKGN